MLECLRLCEFVQIMTSTVVDGLPLIKTSTQHRHLHVAFFFSSLVGGNAEVGTYLLAADILKRQYYLTLSPSGMTLGSSKGTITISFNNEVYINDCLAPRYISISTVLPVLETTYIKRPPALRDHCSDTTTLFIRPSKMGRIMGSPVAGVRAGGRCPVLCPEHISKTTLARVMKFHGWIDLIQGECSAQES